MVGPETCTVVQRHTMRLLISRLFSFVIISCYLVVVMIYLISLPHSSICVVFTEFPSILIITVSIFIIMIIDCFIKITSCACHYFNHHCHLSLAIFEEQ